MSKEVRESHEISIVQNKGIVGSLEKSPSVDRKKLAENLPCSKKIYI